MCRMDEAAVQVTGRYYDALRGQRDVIASTSSALYTEASVRSRQTITVRCRFTNPCCTPARLKGPSLPALVLQGA